MESILTEFGFQTSGRDNLVDITEKIQEKIKESKVSEGVCLVFNPHTSAGTAIARGNEPDVSLDIISLLDRQIPWDGGYHHHEGNCACHVKTTIMGTSRMIVIRDGEPLLGKNQRVFFCDFNGPRPRKVLLKIMGSTTG